MRRLLWDIQLNPPRFTACFPSPSGHRYLTLPILARVSSMETARVVASAQLAEYSAEHLEGLLAAQPHGGRSWTS